jgi:hypothetical protein
MTAFVRAIVLGALVIAGMSGATTVRWAEAFRTEVLRGACYCRAEGTLQCTAGLSEAECRTRCEEALCDDWFWKERLPCWNWGYGG